MGTYKLVLWPEYQEYMGEQWFYDKAILAVGAEDRVGTCAYFIPERRIVFEEIPAHENYLIVFSLKLNQERCPLFAFVG